MTQEVTIRIAFGGEEPAVSTSGAGAGAAAGEAPGPVALEQLQLTGAADSPAPRSPEELAELTQAASATRETGPPRPLEIEDLQGGTAGAAPSPEALGQLGGAGGGPPAPQSLEALGVEGEGGGAPAPVSPEELEDKGMPEEAAGPG